MAVGVPVGGGSLTGVVISDLCGLKLGGALASVLFAWAVLLVLETSVPVGVVRWADKVIGTFSGLASWFGLAWDVLGVVSVGALAFKGVPDGFVTGTVPGVGGGLGGL